MTSFRCRKCQSPKHYIRKHLLTGKSDNIVHKGNCLICKWSRCSLRITKLSLVSVHQGLHRILGHCNQCCIRRPQSNHQSDLEPNIALLFFPFLHSPNVQTWEYMRATSKQGKIYLWHHTCLEMPTIYQSKDSTQTYISSNWWYLGISLFCNCINQYVLLSVL